VSKLKYEPVAIAGFFTTAAVGALAALVQQHYLTQSQVVDYTSILAVVVPGVTWVTRLLTRSKASLAAVQSVGLPSSADLLPPGVGAPAPVPPAAAPPSPPSPFQLPTGPSTTP
jgi:hypothetical protein